MKKMAYLLTLFSFLSLIFLFPVSIQATPTFGIGPSAPHIEPEILGSYIGGPDTAEDDNVEYIEYFADIYIDPENDNPAFALPSSGDKCTLWFGFDKGFSDPDLYTRDVFFATNALDGDYFTFTVELGEGQEIVYDFQPIEEVVGDIEITNQIDGYKFADPEADPPITYFGANVSRPREDENGDLQDGWVIAPEDSPFFGGKKEFYFLTGTLEYEGEGFGFNFNGEEAMFAFADLDGSGEISDNEANPRTTSLMYPVPEPATIFLLGFVMLGLVAVKRRFKKGEQSL